MTLNSPFPITPRPHNHRYQSVTYVGKNMQVFDTLHSRGCGYRGPPATFKAKGFLPPTVHALWE